MRRAPVGAEKCESAAPALPTRGRHRPIRVRATSPATAPVRHEWQAKTELFGGWRTPCREPCPPRRQHRPDPTTGPAPTVPPPDPPPPCPPHASSAPVTTRATAAVSVHWRL